MSGTAIKTSGIGSSQTSHLNLTVTLSMPPRNPNGDRHLTSFRAQVPVELREEYDILVGNGYRAKEARDIVLSPPPQP